VKSRHLSRLVGCDTITFLRSCPGLFSRSAAIDPLMYPMTASTLPVLAGLVAACVTSLGLWMVARARGREGGLPALFEIAAAGMLIVLCVIHILPEALRLHQQAMVYIAAGLIAGVGIALIQNRAMHASGDQASVILPLAALGLHSTLDGVLYAVAFEASVASGVSAAAGLILHEIPEGAIALTLLLRRGFTLARALVIAFLVAAATTPFGAAISAPVLSALGSDTTGALYAVSAGLLAFMALGPMLQPFRDRPSGQGFAALALGGVLALGFHALPLGTHAHDHDHAHEGEHAH
jgi:zinc and cadmium transporter